MGIGWRWAREEEGWGDKWVWRGGIEEEEREVKWRWEVGGMRVSMWKYLPVQCRQVRSRSKWQAYSSLTHSGRAWVCSSFSSMCSEAGKPR